MEVEGREQVDIDGEPLLYIRLQRPFLLAVGRGAAQWRIIAAKRKFYCAARLNCWRASGN